MSAPLSPRQATRPTLTISVPPAHREAFFQALLRLRDAEAEPFISLSALVVATIVKAAHQLERGAPTEEEDA